MRCARPSPSRPPAARTYHCIFRLPAASRYIPLVALTDDDPARAPLTFKCSSALAVAGVPPIAFPSLCFPPFPRNPQTPSNLSRRTIRNRHLAARSPFPSAASRSDPPVPAMGQCLSWALGLLLPSLWEAEVAISATALLIAALILFLLTSD